MRMAFGLLFVAGLLGGLHLAQKLVARRRRESMAERKQGRADPYRTAAAVPREPAPIAPAPEEAGRSLEPDGSAPWSPIAALFMTWVIGTAIVVTCGGAASSCMACR
jgi:hypothetical protein